MQRQWQSLQLFTRSVHGSCDSSFTHLVPRMHTCRLVIRLMCSFGACAGLQASHERCISVCHGPCCQRPAWVCGGMCSHPLLAMPHPGMCTIYCQHPTTACHGCCPRCLLLSWGAHSHMSPIDDLLFLNARYLLGDASAECMLRCDAPGGGRPCRLLSPPLCRRGLAGSGSSTRSRTSCGHTSGSRASRSAFPTRTPRTAPPARHVRSRPPRRTRCAGRDRLRCPVFRCLRVPASAAWCRKDRAVAGRA